jgi:hypothetical protein
VYFAAAVVQAAQPSSVDAGDEAVDLDEDRHGDLHRNGCGRRPRRSTTSPPGSTPPTGRWSDNGVAAIIPGLHFHDLRHTHKTWLIEDGVAEIAQAKRLGHRLPGVRGIYSHVSATVEQRLVDGLQTAGSTTAPRPNLTASGTRKCLPPAFRSWWACAAG